MNNPLPIAPPDYDFERDEKGEIVWRLPKAGDTIDSSADNTGKGVIITLDYDFKYTASPILIKVKGKYIEKGVDPYAWLKL